VALKVLAEQLVHKDHAVLVDRKDQQEEEARSE
jgi:hypothetical protein